MAIGLFDTRAPLLPLMAEIRAKLDEVLAVGAFVLGPEVRAFEAEFAEYLGVRHVIGVANGTDAITIALRAVGVRPGDDVVVPSFTFYASAEAIASAGARPVFCDVDDSTRNVSVGTVRSVMTPRTTAILSVDLFGVPAPTEELRALGVPVVEDAAQAAGSSFRGRRAGSFGDASTFSFYPSKNLGAFGDGGAIATNDDQIAELARALRFHGSRDKQTFEFVGYNSRLDEMQAAILRILLRHLDEWGDARRALAVTYARSPLAELLRLPEVPTGASPAWHLYVPCHGQADALISALNDRGIGARGYYRVPLHRQPAMRPYVTGTEELPVTEALAATNLALPMTPSLGAKGAAQVIEAVVAATRQLSDS